MYPGRACDNTNLVVNAISLIFLLALRQVLLRVVLAYASRGGVPQGDYTHTTSVDRVAVMFTIAFDGKIRTKVGRGFI